MEPDASSYREILKVNQSSNIFRKGEKDIEDISIKLGFCSVLVPGLSLAVR